MTVDSRYIDDIIDGALGDGLVVSGDVGDKVRAVARAEWGAEPGGDFEDVMVIEHDAEVNITPTGVWVQAWVNVAREPE